MGDTTSPAPAFTSRLALDAYSLAFDSAGNSKLLTLRNTGNSYLSWSIQFYRDWAEIKHSSGTIDPGDWDTLRITVFPYKMPLGVQNDVITLRNNSKDSLFPLPITVHVGPSPLLEYDAQALRIQENRDSAVLVFSNVGNAPGTWEVTTSDSALRPDKAQLTVLAKDKANLLVRVDRAHLTKTEYVFELRLTAPGSGYRLPLRVQNLPEARLPFGFEIAQSEACRETGELHFISNYRFDGSSAVSAPVYGIWNAATGVTRTLTLPRPSKRMDLMRDCSVSAISFAHSAMLVDAVSPKVLRTYPLDTNYTPIDIAVTQAGGVYLNSTTPWASGGYFHFDVADSASSVYKERGTGKFTLTPDDRYLLEANTYFHETWLFDVSGNQPILARPYTNLDAPDAYFFIAGGAQALDQGASLYAFDGAAATPFSLLKRYVVQGPVHFAMEATGRGIVLASLEESVAFLDSTDCRLLYTLSMPYRTLSPDVAGDLPQARQTPGELFLSPDGNTLTVVTRKTLGGPYDPQPAFHESFDLKPIYAVIDSLYPGRKK